VIEYEVAYFGVSGSGPGRFECLASSPGPIGLQNQIIPGDSEVQELHLDWHYLTVKGVKLRLVTCTHTELNRKEVEKLALQAIKFAEQNC
jgi:hypothetical protein